jgi:EAL domain-containing protein (putative c-di-GMP-specific phosphodiesterase class I)/GGDEF domain-containing protein/PAS domain-containing protein
MNLDDILALAAAHSRSELERARVRRTARAIQQEYKRAVAEGRDILSDVGPQDPLTTGTDEIGRITREAQLAKLGTITWLADRKRLIWSDEMSRIVGHPPSTVRPYAQWLFRLIHPDDVGAVRGVLADAWRDRAVKELTCRVVRPDRVTRYLHCRVEVLVDRRGRPYGLIGTGEDVTELELARQDRCRRQRRAETLRTERADRDPLTGLLTRQGFADEVERARRGGGGALLVAAVDLAGSGAEADGSADDDRLAVAVAGVVKKVARRTDVCGLVGPGEFGVLMPRTTERLATALAENLVACLRDQPFVVGPTRLRLDAWGGLVRCPARGEQRGADVLVDAETAWRRARKNGRHLVTLPRPALAGDREEICRDRVRTALAGDRLALYGQPIRSLKLNQVTRQELLLRVVDDTGRIVPPAAFLELAERVGEILPIDRWVIEHAMELISQGPQTTGYQVNISGRSLGDPDLLEHVARTIERYAVEPSRLTFEVTETALISNRTDAVTFADGIKQLGCQFALDDFGRGYASFSYLKYFPIDLVKIDGDFIRDIVTSVPDRVMVRSFVAICRELGIQTAAEYAADEATLDLLRELGVDFAQGDAIGRPQPVARSHRPAVARSGTGERLRTALG